MDASRSAFGTLRNERHQQSVISAFVLSDEPESLSDGRVVGHRERKFKRIDHHGDTIQTSEFSSHNVYLISCCVRHRHDCDISQVKGPGNLPLRNNVVGFSRNLRLEVGPHLQPWKLEGRKNSEDQHQVQCQPRFSNPRHVLLS